MKQFSLTSKFSCHTRADANFRDSFLYWRWTWLHLWQRARSSRKRKWYGPWIHWFTKNPVRFYFSATKDWVDILPFSEIPQTAFHQDMAFSVTLKTPNKFFTTTNFVDSEYTSPDTVRDSPYSYFGRNWNIQGVLNFRGVFPSEFPNPLYNAPQWIRRDHRYLYARPDQFDQIVDGKFVAAVILEHNLVEVNISFRELDLICIFLKIRYFPHGRQNWWTSMTGCEWISILSKEIHFYDWRGISTGWASF